MTDSSPLLARYLQLATSPIQADNFAGLDERYSPEYEQLEGELSLSSSMHGAGNTDWQKVLSGCETLLASQSKDLRVAAWLIWSLYQRESYAGLQAGLAMLQHLCAQHWGELHPLKSRTRAAAIGWLLPRLEQVFAEPVPMWQQLPLFRALAENLRALEEHFSAQLGNDAPLLLPLCRSLEEQLERASQGQAEPASGGTAQARPVQASVQSTSGIDNDKDAHKALRAQQDASRSLCAWWLKQKATDLKPLRLARTLLWLNIESLPEHNAEQVTALRGVPVDKLSSYQERYSQGNYADLLIDLEASIARSPFWLDGQRLVWACLQELNAEQAMREVEIQLALFLQRVPGLEELCFHDGTPFANAETQAWIGAYVLPHLQAPSTEKTPVSTETHRPPPWEESLAMAIQLLRTNGLKTAVQQFKQDMNKAMSGRERFFWQLTLARLCYQAKKYDLAKNLLESLDHTLQSRGLSEWEPDLCIDVLRLLRSCCELLPQRQSGMSKEEIHKKLCHLDLEAVLD